MKDSREEDVIIHLCRRTDKNGRKWSTFLFFYDVPIFKIRFHMDANNDADYENPEISVVEETRRCSTEHRWGIVSLPEKHGE